MAFDYMFAYIADSSAKLILK